MSSVVAAETHVLALMAEAMHQRVYGHPVGRCDPSVCDDPVGEFATEALAVLRDDVSLKALVQYVSEHRSDLGGSA